MTLSLGKGHKTLDALATAQQVLDFKRSYPLLPGTYSSFVAREVVEQVSGVGRYFSSITPDIYSAFANAGVIGNYVYSFRPFVLSGQSGRSNGASQLLGVNPSEADSFEVENDLPTHEGIVYERTSMPLMIGEAFLQARDRIENLQNLDFDIVQFCNQALMASGKNVDATIAAIDGTYRINNLGIPAYRKKSLRLKAEALLARIHRIMRMRMEGFIRLDCEKLGIEDIQGAAVYAAKLLDQKHG